jgi:hypothetical protein
MRLHVTVWLNSSSVYRTMPSIPHLPSHLSSTTKAIIHPPSIYFFCPSSSKIPSASNLLRASSSAQVWIL